MWNESRGPLSLITIPAWLVDASYMFLLTSGFNFSNLTLVPCSLDAFPTFLTLCGTLDGILSQWDFMVNFVEVIQWVNSLKLRLWCRSQHFNNRMRCWINTSTHKLNLIATISNSLFHSTNLHNPFHLRQLHSNQHHQHQCLRHQTHRHLRPLQPTNLGLPRPAILMRCSNRWSPQWNPIFKQWWKRLKNVKSTLLHHKTFQTPCLHTLQAIIRQLYNIHHLDNDPLDDPVLITMDLPHGDLTNVQSPSVAVHDEGVHQDVIEESLLLQKLISSPVRISTERSWEFHHSQVCITSTTMWSTTRWGASSTTWLLLQYANSSGFFLVEKPTFHWVHQPYGWFLSSWTVLQEQVAIVGQVEELLKESLLQASLYMGWSQEVFQSLHQLPPRLCHQTTHSILHLQVSTDTPQ